MKIFNRNNLVLALACLLAIAAVAFACDSDADCDDLEECVCVENFTKRTRNLMPRAKYKPHPLSKINEQQAATAKDLERGLEAAGRSRRAKSKSAKSINCETGFNPRCVSKSAKASKSSSNPN